MTGNWQDGSSFSINMWLEVLQYIVLHDIGAAICDDPSPFDTNDDCMVDFLDFSEISSEWLDCGFADPNDC